MGLFLENNAKHCLQTQTFELIGKNYDEGSDIPLVYFYLRYDSF